jgi:hypothetical protein
MLRHVSVMLSHESSMISLIHFEILEGKASQAANAYVMIFSHLSEISFQLVLPLFRCHMRGSSAGTAKGDCHYRTRNSFMAAPYRACIRRRSCQAK